MWRNPQFPANLVTFIKEVLHGKLYFFVQCKSAKSTNSLRIVSFAYVICCQGVHRPFGYNYTNFFSDTMKKYNPFSSLKFTRNFIRWEDSRKEKAPKFIVEAACQMDGCPAKITIQQLACRKYIFNLTFQGNIKYKRGDLKAIRLTDAKKVKFILSFKTT